LSPPPGHFPSENDNSCVLKIQAQQGIALLTGDIEAEAESWLVETYKDKLKADVLVAPHHGSQTSSTATFLQAVKPDTVLIPAGYRNQFGHPHEEVLQRYKDFQVKWFNSADDGAIQLTFDKDMQAETWRVTEGKYWNYRK
jgi:competence protein ComEC